MTTDLSQLGRLTGTLPLPLAGGRSNERQLAGVSAAANGVGVRCAGVEARDSGGDQAEGVPWLESGPQPRSMPYGGSRGADDLRVLRSVKGTYAE